MSLPYISKPSDCRLEAEQAICDGVQKDTQGLRKMIDDTNFQRMKLEAEVEALREDLAHLTQDHKEVRKKIKFITNVLFFQFVFQMNKLYMTKDFQRAAG